MLAFGSENFFWEYVRIFEIGAIALTEQKIMHLSTLACHGASHVPNDPIQ